MIKIIIFDLDGTLVNTIGGIAYACNQVLSRHNYAIHDVDTYKSFVGHGLKKTILKALPIEVSQSMDTFMEERVFEELLAIYDKKPTINSKVYPGIYELLDWLKSHNIQWGINTNKQHEVAEKVVDEFLKDTDYIGLVGTSKSVDHKPAITGALQLLADDFDTKEVIYVGDSEVDIQTGKNLGVKTVAVTWGFRSKESLLGLGADLVIDHPRELMKFIESQGGRHGKK